MLDPPQNSITLPKEGIKASPFLNQYLCTHTLSEVKTIYAYLQLFPICFSLMAISCRYFRYMVNVFTLIFQSMWNFNARVFHKEAPCGCFAAIFLFILVMVTGQSFTLSSTSPSYLSYTEWKSTDRY